MDAANPSPAVDALLAEAKALGLYTPPLERLREHLEQGAGAGATALLSALCDLALERRGFQWQAAQRVPTAGGYAGVGVREWSVHVLVIAGATMRWRTQWMGMMMLSRKMRFCSVTVKRGGGGNCGGARGKPGVQTPTTTKLHLQMAVVAIIVCIVVEQYLSHVAQPLCFCWPPSVNAQPMDVEAWRQECAQVAPDLRLTIAEGSKDWRSSLKLLGRFCEQLPTRWADLRTGLGRVQADATTAMEKVQLLDVFL